jgi:hypothetical protein
MDRRSFLGTMVGGMAVGAAVRTFPFRVYSFPSAIKIASPSEFPAWMYVADNFLLDLPIPRVKNETYPHTRVSYDRVASCTRLYSGVPLFSDVDLAQVDWA